MGQKADRKPASWLPASRRRATDFSASRVDNYADWISTGFVTREVGCDTYRLIAQPLALPYSALFARVYLRKAQSVTCRDELDVGPEELECG